MYAAEVVRDVEPDARRWFAIVISIRGQVPGIWWHSVASVNICKQYNYFLILTLLTCSISSSLTSSVGISSLVWKKTLRLVLICSSVSPGTGKKRELLLDLQYCLISLSFFAGLILDSGSVAVVVGAEQACLLPALLSCSVFLSWHRLCESSGLPEFY